METTGSVTTSVGEQMLPSEDGLVPYVVLVKETMRRAGDSGVEVEVWVELPEEVRVPPRTKKRTVIEKGLAEAGIEKTPELEARLLDEDAAYVWRPKPPEPAALRLI